VAWHLLPFESVEQLTSQPLPSRPVGVDLPLVRGLAAVPAQDATYPRLPASNAADLREAKVDPVHVTMLGAPSDSH
jgi:hypothetical protein